MAVKYAPFTATEAVKRAKKKVGKAEFSGMCQAFTVTMFGTGGVGDYDRDRDADAVDGWKKARDHGRVVPVSLISDYTAIPMGVMLYWSGGSRGYGHAAVSIGRGQMVTTDGNGRRIAIRNIKGWWARSHKFLGYVTVDGNGFTLADRTAKELDKLDADNYPPNGNPTGDHITWLGERLVAHGFGSHYTRGPGPVWGDADRKNVEAFQQAQGWTGANADGYPGPETLRRLAADPKPAPTPEPPVVTVPAKTWPVTVATFNVIDQRLGTTNKYGHKSWKKGKNFADRVEPMAHLIEDNLRASIVATQEAGNKTSNAQFEQALEKVIGRQWSTRVHGDSRGDLTNAVVAQDKRTPVKGYAWNCPGGRDATGSLLRDVETGGLVLAVSCHAPVGGRGTSMDKLRETYTEYVIAQAEKAAKADAHTYGTKQPIPIIFLGDWNQDRGDKYDGPGRAMKAAGYVDAETLKGIGVVNAKWPTLNGLKSKPFNGSLRYDRIFVKKGSSAPTHVTAWAGPNSDHNPVAVQGLELINTNA